MNKVTSRLMIPQGASSCDPASRRRSGAPRRRWTRSCSALAAVALTLAFAAAPVPAAAATESGSLACSPRLLGAQATGRGLPAIAWVTATAAGVVHREHPYGAVEWRTVQAQSGATSGSWSASAPDLHLANSYPYCT